LLIAPTSIDTKGERTDAVGSGLLHGRNHIPDILLASFALLIGILRRRNAGEPSSSLSASAVGTSAGSEAAWPAAIALGKTHTGRLAGSMNGIPCCMIANGRGLDNDGNDGKQQGTRRRRPDNDKISKCRILQRRRQEGGGRGLRSASTNMYTRTRVPAHSRGGNEKDAFSLRFQVRMWFVCV